jgi:hypothetical protein
VKVAEYFDRGDVCPRIVDNPFAAVLDDVLEELKRLIYLPPLAGFFLQEATVNTWHDLVEILTGARLISYGITWQGTGTNKLNVLRWDHKHTEMSGQLNTKAKYYPCAISCINVELAPL